jgi:hypothetical protein
MTDKEKLVGISKHVQKSLVAKSQVCSTHAFGTFGKVQHLFP